MTRLREEHQRFDAAIRSGIRPSGPVLDDWQLSAATLLGHDGVTAERRSLESELLGLGPLAPLVEDLTVTDILVNGDGALWVDRGSGVQRVGAVPPETVRPLAVRLAGAAGRRLDDAQPWVDGTLAGGIRVHAVLPPIATGGAHVSLRIARHRLGGLEDLIALGAADPAIADVLRAIVTHRLSFVVTGGTGSGKTTVLGAMLASCDPADRIVLVEDVGELVPVHPHVVRLQGRQANVEGAGSATLVDLVRQALRMRPDRLVVGEVRGAEVRELLAALNTGHEGGAGTLHANGLIDVPARVEALAALSGMPRDAVHVQLAGGVRTVVHVERRGPLRVVAAVGRLVRRGGTVEVEPVVVAVPGEGARVLAPTAYAALLRDGDR